MTSDAVVADHFALRGEPVAVCLTPGELSALLVRAIREAGGSATEAGGGLSGAVFRSRELQAGGALPWLALSRLELSAIVREAVRWALSLSPPEPRHAPVWPDDGDELGAAALGAALPGPCDCAEGEDSESCPCACHRAAAERIKEAMR